MGWRHPSGSTRRGRRCSAPPPSSPRRRGPAPGPGRTGPPRAGRTPGRDRPRGDPTGRRPGGRPGDAGALSRLRTRGIARSARGLDRSSPAQEGRPAMSRFPFTIANLMGVVVAAAVVSVVFLFDPMLALAVFVAAGLGLAGYLLREDLAYLLDRAWMSWDARSARPGWSCCGSGSSRRPRSCSTTQPRTHRSGAGISSGTRGNSTSSSATTWRTWRPRGPGTARWPTCSCRTTRTSCRPGGW